MIALAASARLTRALKSALLASAALIVAPGVIHAQTFSPVGPSLQVGAVDLGLMNGADGPNDRAPGAPPTIGTESGAVQTVAVDPFDPNLILAGAPNGGIWRSIDGGKTWKAMTDTKASLSIGGISFDITDKSGLTAIAGIGVTSSGTTFGVSGGKLTDYFERGRGGNVTDGLLVTHDGGASWSNLNLNIPQSIGILNVSIRGATIMAAAFNEEGGWDQGKIEPGSGLYRSTDGGRTFTLLGADAGLPQGAASALVGDPMDPDHFYVAISPTGKNAGAALYSSHDGGKTWNQVFSAANAPDAIIKGDPTMLRVAAGPNGAVAVGIVDGALGAMRHAYLSKNGGATWSDLSTALDPATLPNTGDGGGVSSLGFKNGGETPTSINPGGQASIHSVIAIDPNNPDVVYMAGDRLADYGKDGGWSANAVRAQLNADGTVTWAPLTDDFTADGSTVHPDCRAMAFDAKGNLLMGTDGGLYYRTSPQTTNGSWYGMNDGRQLLEIYSMALDPNSGLIAVAAQDNGSALQSARGSSLFYEINGGDGTVAMINGKSSASQGISYVYSASQYMGGLMRLQFDRNGISPDPTYLYFYDQKSLTYLTINENTVSFSPSIKLNNIDPTLIAFGVAPGVFTTRDTLAAGNFFDSSQTDCSSGCFVALPSNFAGRTGLATAIDYGTQDNTYALLVGSTLYGSRLFVSTGSTADTISLKPVSSYMNMTYNHENAYAPTSVLFDPRSQNRFFAVDSNILYGTTDVGATGNLLNAFLPSDFTRPISLGFISSNGVNALLVGGLNTVDDVGNPLVVADSDASGVLSNWRRFGVGLPNTQIIRLDYQAAIDALAVGAFGRGAFIIYDVTSYFASATTLQFGLADNDSHPDASYLNGNRPLYKYGSGTLTLTGAPTFTGEIFLKNGLTQISADANLGDASNAMTFDGGALRTLAGLTTHRAATLTQNSGLIDTNGFNSTWAGVISGPGGLIKGGQGALTLSNVNTYTGGTAVLGGTLIVSGTITGQTQVGPSGVLGGSGLVSGPVFLNGGAIRPGGPAGAGGLVAQMLGATRAGSTTTLTISQLAAPGGGKLSLSLTPDGATSLTVLGVANLDHITLETDIAPGTKLGYYQHFTAITAGSIVGQFAGINTSFSAVAGSPAFSRINTALGPNSLAVEVLNPIDWGVGAANRNQASLAALFNTVQLTGTDAQLSAMNAAYGGGPTDRRVNMEAVSGEGLINNVLLSSALSARFSELIAARMAGRSDGDDTPRTLADNSLRRFTPGSASMLDMASAASAEATAANSAVSTGEVWSKALHFNEKLSSDSVPVTTVASGLAAGYDRVDDATRLRYGFAVAYMQGEARTKALGTKGIGDYWQGALYASRQFGPWVVGASAAMTVGDMTAQRNLALYGGGGFNLVTSGRTDARVEEVQLVAGRSFALKDGWRLRTAASASYRSVTQGAYRENGTNPFVLNLSSARLDQVHMDFGLDLTRSFSFGGRTYDPYVGLVDSQLVGGRAEASSKVSLQGFPGARLTIYSAHDKADGYSARVGMNMKAGSDFKLGLEAASVLSSRLIDHSVMLSAVKRW